LDKTPEQIFVNTLRQEYELSPAACQGILELAKQCLFGEAPSSVGRQRFICASLTALHGRLVREQEKVTVELTLDKGVEDLDVLRTQGYKGLRQLKILRLTEEAYLQGGLLTQEDLSRLLQVTSRTIREDIRDLVKEGMVVRTRGLEQDIGRTLSHKARIIDLYLSGHVYADIMRRSRHSAHAVKRYIGSFSRLLLLKSRGVDDVKEISRVLCQSERLTREYLKLFERYKQGDKWPKIYVELVDQLSTLYPAKKKAVARGGAREN
jgi:hypothetical protein